MKSLGLALFLTLNLASVQDTVLDRVVMRVKADVAQGLIPAIVFDLDDTLYDTGTRTYKILKELAEEADVKGHYPELADKIAKLKPTEVKYEFGDNLSALGVVEPAIVAKAKEFWLARFFSSAYCIDDLPNPGAVAYVNKLHSAGAEIIYVSGRDVPRMQDGTVASLKKQGMPLDNRTELLLKPDPATDDLAFKKAVFARLLAEKKVVAGFENEPRNINLLHDTFVDATMVFLNTRHSNKPDTPYADIASVEDFLNVGSRRELKLRKGF